MWRRILHTDAPYVLRESIPLHFGMILRYVEEDTCALAT
jgi:hypothetical protein